VYRQEVVQRRIKLLLLVIVDIAAGLKGMVEVLYKHDLR
jgi:hypothetical protein